MLSVNGNKK